VIEPKDLPPEVSVGGGISKAVTSAAVVATSVANSTVTPADTTVAMVVTDISVSAPLAAPGLDGWEAGLEIEAVALLDSGRLDVWDELTRRFESRLILAALANTKGRRIEAAHKLGIGRNTITRKIQELGLE
jgi:two-component system, NtrC family, nitrogen regulation response regulator GlnG